MDNMLKKCRVCQAVKAKTEFYAGNNCKQCDNKGRIQAQYQLKLKAIVYKGGKCTHCGYHEHFAALAFHHLYGKEMVWNQMRNRSWKTVQKELDKCQLLCINCHYIVHAEEKHA